MKNLFFFTAVFALITMVHAEESLFPKLEFQEEETEVIKAPEFVSPEIEENNSDTGILPSESTKIDETVENEFQEERQTDIIEEEETEEDEETEEKVYIALNNIKTTVAAVKAVSYCSADFVVYNDFKKRPLQELSVTLKIGNTEKKFDFKDLAPKGTTGKKFIMVSEDCADILKVPPVDIQKCKIKGIPDKKCKEKINFIPIPQDNIKKK